MPGGGKGRKEVGNHEARLHRNEARLHQKEFRVNMLGIMKPATRRLARRAGLKSIGGLILKEKRGNVEIVLKDVILDRSLIHKENRGMLIALVKHIIRDTVMDDVHAF